MKIKVEKLKAEINGHQYEIQNAEFEISVKEIQEMNEGGGVISYPAPLQPVLNEKKELHYTFIRPKSWSGKGAAQICVGDMVEVMCSDDCVTNADTIKYDERISGKTYIVSGIYRSQNKVLLSGAFYVHPHWLKLIKRDQ